MVLYLFAPYISFNSSFFDALDEAGSVVVFIALPPPLIARPSLKNSLSVATFMVAAVLVVAVVAMAGECRRCSVSSLSMNFISSK